MPKTDQDLRQNRGRAFKMKSPFRFSTYIRHLMSLAVIIHVARTLVRAFVRVLRITSFSRIQSTKVICLKYWP